MSETRTGPDQNLKKMERFPGAREHFLARPLVSDRFGATAPSQGRFAFLEFAVLVKCGTRQKQQRIDKPKICYAGTWSFGAGPGAIMQDRLSLPWLAWIGSIMQDRHCECEYPA